MMTEAYSITQSVTPTFEPLTLDEAKAHLRVTFNDDDALIEGYIAAAREYAETHTRRQLCTATYVMRMATLPTLIELPNPPLASVTSITYVDLAGDTQTLSSSLYTVDPYSYPAKIVPAYNATYPAVRGHVNDVTITYVCGTAAASVPVKAKQAILLLVGHFYEQREEVADARLAKVPTAAEALLNQLSWGDYR